MTTAPDRGECPRCKKLGARHRAFFAAGFWGFTCDPQNARRDVAPGITDHDAAAADGDHDVEQDTVAGEGDNPSGP